MRVLVIAALFATGCFGLPASPPVYVPINQRPHTLYVKKPEQVEMYMTGRPSRPFVEIGLIEVQQDMDAFTSRELIARMRAFAGQRGCDALAIFSGNESISDPGGKLPASTVHGYRGSCIVYTTAAEGRGLASGDARGNWQQMSSEGWGSQQAGSPPPVASQPSAAASEPLRCIPNSTQQCWGPAACRGAQSCVASGDAYTPCDCGGTGMRAASKR